MNKKVLQITIVLIMVSVVLGPRLLDDEAPTILVEGLEDSGTVSGSVKVSVRSFDSGTGVGRLTVTVGDDPLDSTGEGSERQWSLDTIGFSDGLHVLKVVVEDRAFSPNQATVELPIMVDNTGPVAIVPSRSLEAFQGKTWGFFVDFDEPTVSVEVETPDGLLPMYPLSDDLRKYRGLRGIWVEAEVGDFPVLVRATDRFGNESQQSFVVEVKDTEFLYGGLVRLPKRVQKLTSETDKNELQRTRRAEAYAVQIKDQLWEGPFIVPTQGRWSSPFGRFRKYNNGDARHHLGMDIANREGTPVYAANHGKVTRSELQHSFGEVVIIGHGHNLSSSYNHLVKRAVEEGEDVRKGQIVGWMGTTGLSTGPHLHWGMECGGYAIDPEQWLTESFE